MVKLGRLLLKAVPLAVALLLVGPLSYAADKTPAKEKKKGRISGRMMIRDNGPLSDGQVLFYNAASGPPPLAEKYERTPDIVRDLDDEGRFNVELPAGTYYLGAVKRQSGERMGPAQEGDLVYRSLDSKGNPKKYRVKAGKQLDLGTIAEVASLKKDVHVSQQTATAISGLVFDMEGKPVPDAVVVAFLKPSLKNKPLFVSERTGNDGKYLLRTTPGTYYLRVRNAFASGPPEPGQIVGYYGDGAPAPITVKEGERLKDLNFKVILFPGRGPFSGTTPVQ